MYVEPNSEIRFMHAPLTPDYSDSIHFDTVADQTAYFQALQGAGIGSQSYVRKGVGIIRCSLPMSTMYNINYMMYRNTSFENKWFYAFVRRVEYVNNGLCYVYFTIDVIQTWFEQNGVLGQCFVAREIVANDAIGANIEPESVQIGEYVCEAGTPQSMANMYTVVIIAIVDVTGSSRGKIYDRTYGGATLYAYNRADSQGINALIDTYVNAGKPEAILSMYMAPLISLPDSTIPSDHIIPENAAPEWHYYTGETVNTANGFQGYVPKNHKLFTYPYNFCRVNTGQGNYADFRYEYFDNLTPYFVIQANLCSPVSAVCFPAGYKHMQYSETTSNPFYTEGVSINGFPMCSWNYDTYAAWVAQNSVPMAMQRASWKAKADLTYKNTAFDTLAGALAQASYGNLTGALTGVMTSAADVKTDLAKSEIDLATTQMQANYSASIEADTMGGTISNGSVCNATGGMMFEYSRWHIPRENAESIDNYFSMFGYTVNKVKVPDITSRPHWNYVQTVDCQIKGNMPADDKLLIKQIFDKGIRFWHKGTEVGNYTLDNSPAS